MIYEGDGSGRSNFTERNLPPADIEKNYEVEVTFRESGTVLRTDVSLTGLYGSDSFNEKFYYDGELGALYSKKKTEFRVWSPVSEEIVLRIYETGTPASLGGSDSHEDHEMTKVDKGVFVCALEGDYDGKYYTYFVKNSTYPQGAEVVDPYARAAGVNGLRGMVCDFSKTDPEGWNKVKYLPYDRKELTVYETHVADVTSNATWTGSEENRRKYAGMIERGTTYTEGEKTVTTGFDHIVELGVNAVQLLPIFDQANDETKYAFNWGYNPLNYNVLEGLYSSDPYDGYARIREFKELVKAFHNEGITVIMDVVYNHVNGAIGSSFDVLMPGYYYRYKNDGSLSNGSGCGNETASEHVMMRKFMIDSVCFWLDEYKLGGFRFDLMGLHDIETMNEVAAAAKKVNPYVVIYGEPWTGGATPLDADLQAVQANGKNFEGYGQFNDQMRDALIMGGLHGPSELGWITGTALSKPNLESIEEGIMGNTVGGASKIYDPDRTTNYVTCHDNFTLYDRIVASGTKDEDTIRKMAVLANAVVFSSKGTGFMLGGEEFLRTKQGDSNSYMSSDEINGFDYSLKIKNYDVFENYQRLIDLKKRMSALHDDTPMVIEEQDGGAVLLVSFASDGKDWLIIHHNGAPASTPIDTAGYNVVFDTLNQFQGGDSVVPENYQTLVLNR